jgi:hypothetical protein
VIRPATLSAWAALGLVLTAPARAQPETDNSARFAAEAVRICVDTRAAAAPVRQLAAAQGWAKAESKDLPYESSLTVGDQKLHRNVTFHPSDIWIADKDGLALIVAVYDIAERPKLKQCEVMAWDLDAESVHRALKSDPRVKGGFPEPGIGSRRYWVKGTYFRYGSGTVGTRSLHVLSAL